MTALITSANEKDLYSSLHFTFDCVAHFIGMELRIKINAL